LLEDESILTSRCDRNTVSPPPMAALARANDPWRIAERQAEAA